MRAPRQRTLRTIRRQQLGPQFGEVDFLRVRRFLLVFAQDHRAREVLDRFFDYVREDAHHGGRLRFGEAFGFEALDEFEGVEVVVFLAGGGGGEGLGFGEGLLVRMVVVVGEGGWSRWGASAVVPLRLGEGGGGCCAGVEGLMVLGDYGGVGRADRVGGGKAAVGGADGVAGEGGGHIGRRREVCPV